MISNFKEEANFPYKLLLINIQVSRLRKAFANNSPANKKLSKTELYKTVHPGEFLGRTPGPLLETGWPLIKNVLKPLAKSVLIPLGLIVTTDEQFRRKRLDQALLQ